MKRMGLGLLAIIVAGVAGLPGCSQSPPWPDSVSVDAYRGIEPVTASGATRSISVAGVQAASGGAYVDLMVTGPSEEVPRFAAHWGSVISRADDPNKLLQIRTESGATIKLQRMSEARALLPAVDPADPPGAVLDDSDGTMRFIQRTMLRTQPSLREGQVLEVRILDPWADKRSEPAQPEVPSIDSTWRRVVVQRNAGS